MRSQDAIFVPEGEGHRQHILGMTHVNKVTPQADNAPYLVIELSIPPGCGAPMHRHETDAECFYVLDGEITFVTPHGEIVGRPGSFCHLPGGGSHAFRNDSATSARALVISSPGAAAYDFFDEVDRRTRGAMDIGIVTDAAARNGLKIIAPAAA